MVRPDSFDSPDGRTYSGPAGDVTPEQAAGIPDMYARHVRAAWPAELTDFAAAEIAGRWEHMTSPRERKFWAEVDAALVAGDRIVRDVLESLCRRDGLSLESSVVPGEPARNYDLALRLGIGHVFGLGDPAQTLRDSPGADLDDGYPDSEREADALAYQRNGDDERDDQ